MSVKIISANDAVKLLSNGAILVDIRNKDERAREYIEASLSQPLDNLSQGINTTASCIIFHCQSGVRTQANTAILEQANLACENIYILEGGLNGWKRAGFKTIVDKKQPLPIMRQVQIAAGGLILLGVLLGTLVSPWWYALSGFVGAGLIFAGVTGFCGMAVLLAKMPWNK